MEDFVMSVRSVENGAFTDEVGPTQYLVVPRGQPLLPMYAIAANQWYAKVLAASAWKNQDGEARGDILFMVHGYNMNESEVIERHRLLAQDLEALQFKGAIVSYDWPSDDKALAYLSDRHKAKITALRLMSDGIRYLSAKQTPDCPINIHVMGHSTGAYVLREAFDDADDALLANGGWNVSQVIFAAGDVSSTSMAKDDGGADAIYRHCVRLTNYSSRYDVALGISNVKRAGVAPRVGRVGLPRRLPFLGGQCRLLLLLRTTGRTRVDHRRNRPARRYKRGTQPFMVFRKQDIRARSFQCAHRYGSRHHEDPFQRRGR